MNEAQTRRVLIDGALEQDGWDVMDQRKVGSEIPVDSFDPGQWQALHSALRREGLEPDQALPKGISDYVLYRDNGDILAVVEGKRRTLLVIATGTGKTRTAMSLVDVFMRSKQAQNILFVANHDTQSEQLFDTLLHKAFRGALSAKELQNA